MTVLELRELGAKHAEDARAIKDKVDAEGRSMSTEEAEQFDALLKKSDSVEAEADRQERLERTEARLATAKAPDTKPTIATAGRVEVLNRELFRFGKLRSFTGPTKELDAYKAGKWIMATMMGNADARQWCHEHGVEVRVQTEGVNTAGGFVVPDVMERAIIDLRETYGMARQHCRVLPMVSDHTIVPRRTGGVTAYFVGETAEITASDKSWNQVELTAKKLAALTRMSSDLNEDSIMNMADDLAGEMAYAFAVKEDQCCMIGNGNSTYGGMTGLYTKFDPDLDGTHTAGAIDGGTPCTAHFQLDTADLTAVMAALPVYARAGAKWHINPIAKVAVFDRLLLAAGGNTNQNLAAGQPASYGGYPIVEWQAAVGTDPWVNDNPVFFLGNMALSSTLGDRRGITVKVSDQRYIEYDQIAIQATERFCINHHDLGDNTTAGPLVALIATT